MHLFALDNRTESKRTNWSFWFDERLLSNRLSTVRATRQFSQNEIVSTVLAGNLSQYPIEGDLGVIRMTMFAGLDKRFGSAD
jgi:hypothetical protein